MAWNFLFDIAIIAADLDLPPADGIDSAADLRSQRRRAVTEEGIWPLLAGGELRETTGRAIIRNPWSGSVVGHASMGTKADVVAALDAAAAAAPAAAALPSHARAAVLDRIADGVAAERDLLLHCWLPRRGSHSRGRRPKSTGRCSSSAGAEEAQRSR